MKWQTTLIRDAIVGEYPLILTLFCYYQWGKIILLVCFVSFPIMVMGAFSLFIMSFSCICFIHRSAIFVDSKIVRVLFYFFVVLFVQNIVFSGLNWSTGHMWLVASVRAFLGTDACFDNGLFWSDFSDGNQYNFAQILVYSGYWIM